MDPITLVEEWKEAGRLFRDEFQKHYPVKACFWLKRSDDDQWYLYVASEKIDARSEQTAYTEVVRSAKRIEGAYLDSFRVKLVRVNDPIVRAVLDIQNRYPGRIGTYFNGPRLGGEDVDSVYIYPAAATVPD